MNRAGKTYIIAEAGVNHNGSLEMSRKLIDVAAEAGADAVKFQTFKADSLVTGCAPKAAYQIVNSGNSRSQHEMLKALELDPAAHAALIEYCQERAIEFLSTPFDLDSLELLVKKFSLFRLKVSSGDITNAPFLLAIARTGKPVILSTGMSTLAEVESALNVLAFGYCQPQECPSTDAFVQVYFSAAGQAALQEKVMLLHCTTEYPAPYDQVNLRAMDTLAQAFNLPVGLSDHTPGIAIPIAAVARGATLIEKHFTLDKNLPGPDHRASLDPDELKSLVSAIRQVEVAMGTGIKMPTASELPNRIIARKSIVASHNIKQGDIFSESNLTIKRPGDGLSPACYWDLLGKRADKDYKIDERIVV